MTKLSEKANLSKKYTNHCVRVTTVTNLKRKGYSDEDIAYVTGHKNVLSIARYNRVPKTDERLHYMSNSLVSAQPITDDKPTTIVQPMMPIDMRVMTWQATMKRQNTVKQ